MDIKRTALLLALIALCESVGAIGANFTALSVENWYVLLAKPSFSPPAWVFAPVWITLYAMMGVSFFLVLVKRDAMNVKKAAAVFLVQLFLNGIWSPVFFGMRAPLAGFVIICLLLISIVIAMVSFFKISRPASYLLLPYLLWVSFATILNFYIVKLN